MLPNSTGVPDAAVALTWKPVPGVPKITPRGEFALKKFAGRLLGAENPSGTPSQLISRRPVPKLPLTLGFSVPSAVLKASTVDWMPAGFAPEAEKMIGAAWASGYADMASPSFEPPLCAADFAALEPLAEHKTCRSGKSVICPYVEIGTRESRGGAVKRFDAGMTQFSSKFEDHLRATSFGFARSQRAGASSARSSRVSAISAGLMISPANGYPSDAGTDRRFRGA